MDRRAFIRGLWGVPALLAPLAASAQTTTRVRRIGWLGVGDRPPPDVIEQRYPPLKALGWIEGKNLIVEQRYANNRGSRHAIVDRILERGRLLQLDGPSVRTKHLRLDDFPTEALSTQVGRISGIEWAENSGTNTTHADGFLDQPALSRSTRSLARSKGKAAANTW